jgi:hypothetical protein
LRCVLSERCVPKYVRYDRMVVRVLKTLATMALALVVAVVPVLLDRCAEGCAAHAPASVAATPACHHARSPAPTMGQAARQCAHGEEPAALVAVKNTAPAQTTFPLIAVVVDRPGTIDQPGAALRLRDAAPPGSSLTLDTSSLPLRI